MVTPFLYLLPAQLPRHPPPAKVGGGGEVYCVTQWKGGEFLHHHTPLTSQIFLWNSIASPPICLSACLFPHWLSWSQSVSTAHPVLSLLSQLVLVSLLRTSPNHCVLPWVLIRSTASRFCSPSCFLSSLSLTISLQLSYQFIVKYSQRKK